MVEHDVKAFVLTSGNLHAARAGRRGSWTTSTASPRGARRRVRASTPCTPTASKESRGTSMSAQNGLVQRLWSYCNVLRDDGLSYGDYLEQLTYLLFLKMADEQTKPPFSRPAVVPEGLDWPSLLARDGDELEVHYRHVLTELGRKPGMLGVVFRKAQNRIQDPAKLRRLVVDLIDRETWLTLDADVKGDAYEGLLEKNAEDVKSGAGQYFTPRPLIRAIVEVMRPAPGSGSATRPAAPAGSCSPRTSGSRSNQLLDPDQKRQLRYEALQRLGDRRQHRAPLRDEPAAARHRRRGRTRARSSSTTRCKADPGERFEMVLTNPPFGRKSSMTFVNDEGEVEREDLVVVRDDFWASTSNKQLNFVQHVKTLLGDQRPRRDGRARQRALRGRRGRDGAPQAARTSATCTRCCACRPAIFYAQGVKANVLFFDRKPASETPWTRELWVYDLRTNQHFTLKQNPLRLRAPAGLRRGYSADDRAAARRVGAVPALRLRRADRSATRSASTSSGSATSRSRTWRTCRRRT